MNSSLRIQQELNTSGDRIQNLRGELREAVLEAQKRRLVDTYYEEVTQADWLRLDNLDYDQFGSMPTAKRPTERLATKDLNYYAWGATLKATYSIAIVLDRGPRANSARQSAEQVDTTLTTIDDQPIDTAWSPRPEEGLLGSKRQ